MRKILFVDDDSSIRRLLRRILDRHFGADIEVHESVDFADARRQLATLPFNVLITDIYLQHQNGLDLIAAAKDANPCLQVIAITATPTLELIRYAAGCGVTDFCVKPLQPADIMARLGEAMERAARWRLALGGAVCQQFTTVTSGGGTGDA
jgi:DNA-binding NtrC family response regulator